jgi:hypothetical protein
LKQFSLQAKRLIKSCFVCCMTIGGGRYPLLVVSIQTPACFVCYTNPHRAAPAWYESPNAPIADGF